MDKDYEKKVQEMKIEVMDAKKKFESRIDEFRKQMNDYKQNNEVIDEMKKAHQKELGAYIQEHNKKYNELLKEKLNSEDALKAAFDKEKASLIKEWEKKLKEAVEKARQEEKDKSKKEMDTLTKNYENQIDSLEGKIKKMQGEIDDLTRKLKDKDGTITEREKEIKNKNVSIEDLEKEIHRLKDMNEGHGKEGEQLSTQIAHLKQQVRDSNHKIEELRESLM